MSRKKKNKGYWQGRLDKWGNRYDLVDKKKLNRGLNYAILVAETVLVIYLLNSVYGCPCAFRTCGIKQYQNDGETLKWEATNLDCPYVEEYIKGTVGLYHDELSDARGLQMPNETDKFTMYDGRIIN